MPSLDGREDAALDITRFDRRNVLLAAGAGALSLAGLAFSQNSPPPGGATALGAEAIGWDAKSGKYVLPPLPYDYKALEPHIDAETMQLHHDKHHKGYVDGLNNALDKLAEIRAGKRDASEVKAWSRELAFHGSGHFLHVLFWSCMSPQGGKPEGAAAEHIERDFGSFDNFARHFTAAASSVEGSGWALLVFEPNARRLMIMQAEKHQNLTAWGVTPLLAVDVWEHAYYLKYQNRRPDYVKAFMNVINWAFVNRMVSGVIAR